MRAEVETRPDAGLVTGRDPGAAEHHLVLTVIAGRAEIVVIGMNPSAGQRIEMILQPLPDVAKHVVETGLGGRAGLHRTGGPVRQMQIPAVLAPQGNAIALHHRIGDNAQAARPALLIAAQRLMLGFAGQAIGHTFLSAAPGAIGPGLVIVDLDRPIPGHIDDFEQGAQLEAVQAGRTIRHPEGRPLDIAKAAPFPAGLRPAGALTVTASDHEGVKFAIADQIAAGLKRLQRRLALTVFVIPTVGGPIDRLAQGHGLGGHGKGSVVGKVPARLRRENRGRTCRRWMQGRPGGGPLHLLQRQFMDQHRRGFQMDALMLKAHEQRPQRLILGDRRMTSGQSGMGFDHAAHGAIDLLAVGMHRANLRPEHLVLGHVVPAHFIDAGFEQPFKVDIQRLLDQAGDAQLVDVQRRRMPVVEDHRVAQMMIGRAKKRFLAAQAGEQDFG